MPLRLGPGPVFVYESLTASRRASVYAVRSLFVLALLIGLWSIWERLNSQFVFSYAHRLRMLARVGEEFFLLLQGVQIPLVLLAAPAATAGAVCLDRQRGALAHTLVTDLTDSEIILGKLAARVLPVFGLIACSLPAVSLASLLGGIDPGALTGLTIVSACLAVLGCSLALCVSVRATKTHEALLAVYAVWLLWFLTYPIWDYWGAKYASVPDVPDWYRNLNPFILAVAPYRKPGTVGPLDWLAFAAVTLGASATFLYVAIRRLRGEVERPRPRIDRLQDAVERAVAWLTGWLPGPSLDGNPVLWREWHRNRPSRVTRRLMFAFMTASVGFGTWGIYELVATKPALMTRPGVTIVTRTEVTMVTNLVTVMIGLLFLSVLAPTSMTEERARGSLDVLMSTPLSTRSIVMGKWLGALRLAPWFLVLPLVGSIVYAAKAPRTFTLPAGWPGLPSPPLTRGDLAAAALLPTAHAVAAAALLRSFGLWRGVRVARTGRAVAWGVTGYLALMIGTIFLTEVFLQPALVRWVERNRALLDRLEIVKRTDNNYQLALMQGLVTASPYAGQIIPAENLRALVPGLQCRGLVWWFHGGFVLATALLAAAFLGLTLRSFDRRLGRVSDRAGPRRVDPEAVRRIEAESVFAGLWAK